MVLRVLHAANKWGVGGTEKAAELFVRHHGPGFDASVAALDEGGTRADALERDGYDVARPDDASDLAGVLDSRDVDILHSQSADVELLADAAEAADVPLFVHTDQFGGYFQPDSGKHIDFFCYPSNSILHRTLVLNGFDVDGEWPSQMARVYNPLDVESERTGNSLRTEYNIPEDAPVVGKIGRPAPEKWGKLTVEGFNHVADSLPDARLLLVGVPDKIRHVVEKHGYGDRVTCIDRLTPNEVSDFYASIDVLAHTSAIGESFGYVIAEAMANEVPVVVDSTPMRDNAQIELVENEVTGYVGNSPSAYGRAIEELLRDDGKREEFGSAGLDHARTFGVETVTNRLEGFYTRLASDHGLPTETPTGGPSTDTQRAELRSFTTEYDRRLDDEFGRADILHRLERTAWRGVSTLPVGRSFAFEYLRKAFIFGNEYV